MKWFIILKKRIHLVSEALPETSATGTAYRNLSQKRFFNYWTDRESPSPKRLFRKRKSPGIYYCDSLSRPQRRKKRVLLLLLTVLSSIFLYFSIRSSFVLYDRGYIFIPQALSVVTALFEFWFVCTAFFTKEKYTFDEYRETAVGFPICTLIWFLLLSLTALLILARGLLISNVSSAVQPFLYLLCSALCTIAILILELKTEYTLEKNL